jgi:hypothetical protein
MWYNPYSTFIITSIKSTMAEETTVEEMTEEETREEEMREDIMNAQGPFDSTFTIHTQVSTRV